MLDLNQMAVFVRVVQRGSFAAAAKELGVPPSTLSRKVTALEQRLGVGLLTRTTRSLRLTEPGTSYFERCAALVAQADEAEQHLAYFGKAPRGTLKLTAPSVFNASVMIPTLGDYLRRFPDVRIELSIEDRRVDLVREGYDLALRVAPRLPDTSLVARKIGTGGHVLCASPAYLGRRGTPRRPGELVEHAICAFGRDSKQVVWSFWEGGRLSTRVKLTPRVLTSSEEGLRSFASEGFGLTLLPAGVGRREFAEGHLVRLLSAYEIEPRNVYAVMPRNRQGSPLVRAYLDILERHLDTQPGVFSV